MREFSPGPSGYWTQALYTTRNALQHAISGGRSLFLEGRHSGDTWHNWTHGEKNRAATWLTPVSENEIIEAVRSHRQIRVVGSGHSFNAGVRSEAQLCLDEYTGFVDDFDHGDVLGELGDTTVVRVKAGTRVRVLNRELAQRGLAIEALPSHDAQSIAGVLATDVHGTGRDVGFVSASVVGLRIIDGRGEVHDVWRGDRLYRAALGGIGAVGIITQVSLRCVPEFRLRQSTVRMPLEQARREWRELLAAHEHVNFYIFPFADHVQLHRWDRTESPLSRLGALREWLGITKAALSAAWIGELTAMTKLLPRIVNFSLRAQRNSNLVLPSANAFNRTIYHMHQELEFAVPIEDTWQVATQLCEIYQSMYGSHRLPFTLIEVRFTPAGGTESLLSPGAGDSARAWYTIACNQAGAIPEFFHAVEQYMKTIDAPPHLGKWCESITATDMASMHRDRFDQFVRLRAAHDPDGRFANDFTNRLFGEPHGSTQGR